MSMQTWKAEFYPEAAGNYILPELDDLAAVRHSIKKWEGLQPDNMRGYAMHWSGGQSISDGDETFYVDGSSCALCQRYAESCKPCPLSEVRGGRSCSVTRVDEALSPWSLRDTQPQVMLMWLKRAEEYLLNQPEIQYKGGDQ